MASTATARSSPDAVPPSTDEIYAAPPIARTSVDAVPPFVSLSNPPLRSSHSDHGPPRSHNLGGKPSSVARHVPPSPSSPAFHLVDPPARPRTRLVPNRRRLSLRRSPHVEALPQGDFWHVLWASDVLAREDSEFYPCVETTSATVEPRAEVDLRDGDMAWERAGEDDRDGMRVRGGRGGGKVSGGSFVCSGDQFEVRVVGFSVAEGFGGAKSRSTQNEMVLTSSETAIKKVATTENGGYGVDVAVTHAPKVHFDFRKDATDTPDRYQPVSEVYSLASRSCGSEERLGVNVQFLIMDIECGGDETRATIDAVSSLAGMLHDVANAMPYVAALSPVLDLAGDLGVKALRTHAKPNRVVGLNMDFKLLRRGDSSVQRSGDYLRFGYYFFLSQPLNVKLYAATRGSKNVRLLLREDNGKFVHLSHVSYVVVKVLVPQEDIAGLERSVLRPEAALRLQHVCENVDDMEPVQVRDEIKSIMMSMKRQGNSLGASLP